ncbi:hypothetical protein [Micromonospora sp. HUAS LYJ1]|uniref:hypothetical protein n=1 Tax=Micromonospora sp. HUAS LYJ1 TaxID=3061626 RepID=UPI002673C7EC|nr:hypothetical protein [Micromonospora sp. HUAS LYJ1]WKU05085.1 hypothetical protein Q2K16_30740 [Micromonospora sp. HUAS LYJ1]
MGGDGGAQWRERQQRAVRAHAAADARQRESEHTQAEELVAWFTAEAIRRGLRTTRLTAQGYDGQGRYRTGLTGWYVDRAGLRAVDVDGRFYLLTVPPSVRARLFGVDVPPARPPLVVGRGGRDGESVPLRDLLTRRLAAGDEGV